MFHHYSEDSSSTGEPPTPPPPPVDPAAAAVPQSGLSGTCPGPEPDSGYEASPSSLHHRFFPDPPSPDDRADEISDSDSDLDLEDWDTCPDCNSSESCYCDCSANYSTCDNSLATAASDASSSGRPSRSVPVQIPAARRQPDLPRADLRLRPARSQPADLTGAQAFGLVTGGLARSWPFPWGSLRGLALPVVLRNLPASLDFGGQRRPLRPRFRSRRQMIDSEASSLGSSDEDGPEDVFNLAAEEASPFSPGCQMVVSSGRLPDVVLQAPDVAARRSRSVSVNLPPEPELLQSIGLRLRRLSDQFQIRREISIRTRRRQTISSFTEHNGFS